MKEQRKRAWGILHRSNSRLDGAREWLAGALTPETGAIPDALRGYNVMAFSTRDACRLFIKEQYAYFSRPDLRAQPHAWKMPKPVRIEIFVSVVK